MMKPILLAWSLLVLAAHAAERPMNVVFILADDLGWSDTTLFGTTSLYQTPNIERLAERGVTFLGGPSRRSEPGSPRSACLVRGFPSTRGIPAKSCRKGAGSKRFHPKGGLPSDR